MNKTAIFITHRVPTYPLAAEHRQTALLNFFFSTFEKSRFLVVSINILFRTRRGVHGHFLLQFFLNPHAISAAIPTSWKLPVNFLDPENLIFQQYRHRCHDDSCKWHWWRNVCYVTANVFSPESTRLPGATKRSAASPELQVKIDSPPDGNKITTAKFRSTESLARARWPRDKNTFVTQRHLWFWFWTSLRSRAALFSDALSLHLIRPCVKRGN